MKRVLVFGLIAGLLATGCSKKDNGDELCGEGVIRDYSEMASNCMNKQSHACQEAVDTFLSEHPGVNCRAENVNASDSGDKTVMLTEGSVKELFLAGSSGSSNNGSDDPTLNKISFVGGEYCSQSVVDDYSEQVVTSCGFGKKYFYDDGEFTHLKECRSKLSNFLVKYPHINCKVISGYGHIQIEEKVLLGKKEQIDQVIILNDQMNAKFGKVVDEILSRGGSKARSNSDSNVIDYSGSVDASETQFGNEPEDGQVVVETGATPSSKAKDNSEEKD